MSGKETPPLLNLIRFGSFCAALLSATLTGHIAQAQPGVPAVAFEEDRLLALSISGGPEKVAVVLLDPQMGVLITLADLNGSVDPERIAPFIVEHSTCGRCVQAEKIGTVTINEVTSSMTLNLNQSVLPKRLPFAAANGDDQYTTHSDPGARMNFMASFNERSDGQDRFVGETELAWSFGSYGTLFADGAYITGDGPRRGDTRLEFVDLPNQLEFHIGDTIAGIGGGGSAVRIAGVRVNKRLGILPGFLVRPSYHFEETTSLKSTIELFVDGKSVKKREVEAGIVEFDYDYISAGRELKVIVTDAAGNEQIYSDTLFPSIRTLRKGVFDYDVSVGTLRRGRETYEDWFASGTLEFGLVSWLSPQIHAEGAEGYIQGSLATAIGLPNGWGKFETQVAAVSNDGAAGNFVRAGYFAEPIASSQYSMSLGFDVYNAEQYRRFGGFQLDELGAQVFAALSAYGISASAAAFRIDDVEGVSSDLRFGYGPVAFAAGVDVFSGEETRVRASVSIRPSNRHIPAGDYNHLYANQQHVGALTVRSQEPLYGVNYRATVAQDYTMSDDRSGRLGLSQNEEKFDWNYQISSVSGNRNQGGGASTGLGLIDGRLHWVGYHDPKAGYLLVDAGLKDIEVRGRRREFQATDSKGQALLRVTPYVPTQVRLNPESVPNNVAVSAPSQSHLVLPGKYGKMKINVRNPGFILRVSRGFAPTQIQVNGTSYIYTPDGAYVDVFHRGLNQVVVGDRQYEVTISHQGEEAIYELDLFDGSIRRLEY